MKMFMILFGLWLSLSHALLDRRSLTDSVGLVGGGTLDRRLSSSSSSDASVLSAPGDLPPHFVVKSRLKQGGNDFHEYDCFIAWLECAAYVAETPWTTTHVSLDCSFTPVVGLKFTGYRPPEQTFETRTILWTLYALLEWFNIQDESGEPSWEELTFQVFPSPSVRLGVGQVISTPGPSRLQSSADPTVANSTQPASLQSLPAAADTLTQPQITNLSSDASQSIHVNDAQVSNASLADEGVNIAFSIIRDGKLVCTDARLYLILIRMIASLSEAGRSRAITQGLRYYFPDDDMALSVGPTSEEAGREGLFTNGILIKALAEIAPIMRQQPVSIRCREFDAKIVTGTQGRGKRGSRLIGKMTVRKGQNGLEDPPAEADVRASPALVS